MMGIKAAGGTEDDIAAASLVSALASTACLCRYFLRKARVYRFGRFSFSPEILGRSLFNGSSEMIGQLSVGIAMFAYNLVILRQAGAAGVTAFTVVGYTSYMFEMVVTGFGQGSSPLASFVWGAGDRTLAQGIRRRTSALASGAGRAVESAVISLSRGLAVLPACIFPLPLLWGMTGIWLAAPVTGAVTLAVSLVCVRRDQTAVEIQEKIVYTREQKHEGGHDP